MLNMHKSFFEKFIIYFFISLPSAAWRLLRMPFYKKKNVEYKQIVIFQLGHLGDMFVTLPLIRNLRYNCPESHLALVVGEWNKQIAQTIPEVDHVIIFNHFFFDRTKTTSIFQFIKYFRHFMKQLNNDHYDLGIDLRGFINTIFPLYFSNIGLLAGFNYKHQGALLDIKIPLYDTVYESERLLALLPQIGLREFIPKYNFDSYPFQDHAAESFLAENNIHLGEVIIGIFPGAPYAPRRWPADNFARLIEKITDTDQGSVIIMGSSNDQKTVFDVMHHLRNKVALMISDDIVMLMSIIRRCSIFVSNDSGPLHIAIAMDIPTVSLFGPGNEKRWGMNRFPHRIVRGSVSCSPCLLKSDTCDNPSVKCMEKISVDSVYDATLEILQATAKPKNK